MALLERLQILIDADAKGAIREFDKIGKEAARASGKVEGKFAKLSNNLTNIGSGVALGGVAVLGGLGKLAMMSEEAEKQTLKLDNSIKNSTQSFAGNGKALKDLANDLQQVTASDADALVGAESLLVSFGLTEDQIKTLLPLVNDFSRKFGVDLEASAKVVGKALNGSTGGLKKYGVEIDKTSLKADAFGTVVEGLAGSVGGFARTEGKTFSGQLEILKNNLGDLAESVGGGAAAVFGDLAGGAASAVGKLNELNPAIGDSVGRIGAIGGISATAVGGLAVVVGQFAKVKAAAVNAEGGLTKFGKAAGAIGAVAAVAVIFQITEALRDARIQSVEFGKAVGNLANAKGPTELTKSFKEAEQTSQSFADKINRFNFRKTDQFESGRISVGNFDVALADVDRTLGSLVDKGNFEAVGNAIALLKTNSKGTKQELEFLAGITKKYEKILADTVPSQVAATVAQRKQTAAVEDAVSKYDKQNATYEGISKSIKTLEADIKLLSAQYAAADAAAAGFGKAIEESTRLDDAVGAVGTLRGSIQGLSGELTGIPKSINDALNPFAKVSEQGQKAVDAVIGFGNASIGYIQQLIAQGAGNLVPAVAERLRGQLTAALQAAGVPPDQIDDYLGLAGLDPIQIEAALKVSNVEAELSKLKTRIELFKSEIEEAPLAIRVAIDQAIINGEIQTANRLLSYVNTNITVGVKVKVVERDSLLGTLAPGLVISDETPRKKRAVGGPVNKSMDYMVNERGPEMFVPNSSGFIMTSNDSKALISGVNSLLQGGYSSPSNTFNITTTDPVLSAVEVVRRQRDANYLLGR